MEIRLQEAYYKLLGGNEFYRMIEIDERNVNITELSDAGIIIYDTRISRNAVENKFNELKLTISTQEEFDKKYFDLKNKEQK